MGYSDVLRSAKAAILDMDGVLWRGGTPLPGFVELFDFFEAHAIPFVLATNNSTNTVAMYVKKLADRGVSVRPEQIVTSAVATASYIKEAYPADTRVHVVGESGLHEILRDAGFPPVMVDADLVVAGLDRDITFLKLKTATYMIRGGATFIGTNGDRSFPQPDGFAPGAGAILAALEAATDQKPIVIGKPEPIMFEMALQRIGVDASHVVMVGDRLETDIFGGKNAGLLTALMMSGVTTPEILAESSIEPDAVFSGIDMLREAWLAVLGT